MVAAGASRVVALVKESVDNEVALFRCKYWTGEVFLDEELQFFRAIGGGTLWNSVVGSVVNTVQAPISSTLSNLGNFTTFYKSSAQMNLRGEGLIGGGCFVINTDGSVAYSFLEKVPGHNPPLDEVIFALHRATHKNEPTASSAFMNHEPFDSSRFLIRKQ
jgi:hypothetical protein